MKEKILAIDIGGSKIIVGITDFDGKVLDYKKFELPQKYDIDFLIDKICEMSQEYLKENPVAAGVTIPGLADSEKGIWLYAPFSNISNIKICDILKQRLGIDAFADNDVNACAKAEKKFGICKNVDNFLWVTVSNGIGGAVYVDGKILCGDNNSAGEIGHFIVEENTQNVCGCGNVGCLEAMASGTGIAKEYFNVTGKYCSAKEIAELAKNGDKDALKVYYQSGYYIGKAVSYCVNILNTGRIVIGGGVSQSMELLKEGIDKGIERYAFKQANKNITVEKTGLGYFAAMSGCAAVAIDRIEGGK